MHALGVTDNEEAATSLRSVASIGGPGTYVLVLRSTSRRSVEIGRIGLLRLEPGYYAYVGSALGPGGLRARLGRHLRGPDRVHWHIDYLRARTEPIEAWYSCGPARREHQWSDVLRASIGAVTPLSGFGASDCRCDAHLFLFARQPAFSDFRARLRRDGLPARGLRRCGPEFVWQKDGVG